MAFLDNSGDIILDAVLTDLGRKRMAQGNFKITKCAFGDDEIDYGLYNKDAVDSTEDLQILQTPVFEAFTGVNANINYRLLSYARRDLLYLPVLKVNDVLSEAILRKNGVFHLAVNGETANKLWDSSTGTGDIASAAGNTYYMQNGARIGQKLIIESGLDTDVLSKDRPTRSSYIVSLGLYDNTFTLSLNNKYFTDATTSGAGAKFTVDEDGAANVAWGSLTPTGVSSTTTALTNYSNATISAIPNLAFDRPGSSTPIGATSVILGPGASAMAFGLRVHSGLTTTSTGGRDSKWSLDGTINDTVFGGSNKYDYIDTTIYLEGDVSSARIQLPIRIIRYAGT